MKTICKSPFPVLIASAIILTGCYSIGNSDEFSVDNPSVAYNEKYIDYDENPFVTVNDQPVSTFSVDADGASYANMRRFLHLGETPPKAAIRIEEFINYFTFDYAEPADGETVTINSELSTCPWETNHHLIRVGIKGKSIPKNELPSSNFVFLIDVSGSMNTPNKLGILKSGFKHLVDELGENDKVAIVTYAGEAAVLLESTCGNEKTKLKNAIDKLGAGGSTAGAAGLTTAYEIATSNFILNGNNRIIIGTDGDFNVGPSNNIELVKLIKEKRETGVYITVLGVGQGNLNDSMMEQIANKGNGNYEYIDNADQLLKVFVNEKAKFHTVAKDAKIQVTFNPNKVVSYRLIGYENRTLKNEDFENDSTDAGEIGSTQTITALYEVVLSDTQNDEKYAQFDVRYKKPGESQSRLLQHEIATTPLSINSTSENMRFVASVAAFGLIMKKSVYKGTANKQLVLSLGHSAVTYDPNEYRKEFMEIVKKWSE